MRNSKKEAYRYLLYRGFLEIRALEHLFRSLRDLNPLSWYGKLRSIQEKGAVANWLHNLALYSSIDFVRFDENRFWADYAAFHARYPLVFEELKTAYERRLQEVDLVRSVPLTAVPDTESAKKERTEGSNVVPLHES
ncbi:hypothetical protein OLMES_1420 [Oleiphilus messinensis]|uniref:Uncharacterized protein n=1 Tax=Oleiphilus messinensis TaxID=141451 RepID=A0A1Y0I4T6_9GAMM|nr:hypothetical protein [Oleiphilus messinensis]ARU55497.1 hypothetical protein OLMES_1420 [Oleiphilus messinensis]